MKREERKDQRAVERRFERRLKKEEEDGLTVQNDVDQPFRREELSVGSTKNYLDLLRRREEERGSDGGLSSPPSERAGGKGER